MRGESLGEDEAFGEWFRCNTCSGTRIFEDAKYCPDCGTHVEVENPAIKQKQDHKALEKP